MPRDWEQFYADPANIDLTPEPMLVDAVKELPPGDALDLACGAGRHALYLARQGWRVTAVDAAAGAIHGLKDRAKGLTVEAHRADLELAEFVIQPQAYDLICCFFYLQPALFSQIREGIRPGGIFAGAVLLEGKFSLKPEELRTEFKSWKIVFYEETDAARIVAHIPDRPPPKPGDCRC